MRRLALLAAVTVIAGMFFSVPAAAGGGCYASEQPTSGRGYKGSTLIIEECMFTPTVVYVDPGTTVNWVNKDPVPHTVSGASLQWGTEEWVEKGDHVSHTFKNEGVFPYYCLLHPSMVAAVVVGDPAASKEAAAPMDADVEMMFETEEKEAATENLDAAPVSSSAGEASGAPWLVVLVVAVLGTGVGAVLGGSQRLRKSAREF